MKRIPIDTIPESHSINLLLEALEPVSKDYIPLVRDPKKWKATVEDPLLDEFYIDVDEDPTCIIQPDYFTPYSDLIIEEFQKKGNFKEKGLLEFEIIRRQVALGMAQNIWQDEFGIVEKGGYTTIFSEGVQWDPVDTYANKLGAKIVKLDRAHEMQPLDELMEIYQVGGPEEQKAIEPIIIQEYSDRELRWIRRIRGQHDYSKALLIVGEDHVKGVFGLPKKMRKIGLRMDQIIEGYPDFYQVLAKTMEPYC